MLTVYKYDIPIEERFTLRLPQYAKILSFQVQRDKPQIWALVDQKSSNHTERQFRLSGTGHPIAERAADLDYIGTCQMREGALIWHLFEYVPF